MADDRGPTTKPIGMPALSCDGQTGPPAVFVAREPTLRRWPQVTQKPASSGQSGGPRADTRSRRPFVPPLGTDARAVHRVRLQKRRQTVCVMVTRGTACMGPVTHTGCGALCPLVGRGCYGCFGPGENPNTAALGQWFAGLGLLPEQIANQFLAINSQAEPFTTDGKTWRDKS